MASVLMLGASGIHSPAMDADVVCNGSDFEVSGWTDIDSSNSDQIDVFITLDYLQMADVGGVYDATVENYNWEAANPPALANVDVATPEVIGTWVVMLEVSTVGEDLTAGLLKSY